MPPGTSDRGSKRAITPVAWRCTPRVSEIPESDHPILETDVAIEFDEEGGELRRWRLPIDRNVIGVRGSDLLLSHGGPDRDDSIALGVGVSGRVFETVYRPGDVEVVPCPDIPDFAGSSYTRCVGFLDPTTSDTRRIAYLAPCT